MIETLLSERGTTRGITEPAVVKRYIDHHLDGTLDHTHQLWSLLMLELWFQRFIDKN